MFQVGQHPFRHHFDRVVGRERYLPRRRYLYALRFRGRQCYIGQTINPARRFREHRKAWHRKFRPLILGSIVGSRVDAERCEQAYRYLAWKKGWSILFDADQPDAVLRHPWNIYVSGLRLPWIMRWWR